MLGRLPPRTKEELGLELGLNETHIKVKISSLDTVPVKPGIILIDNDNGNKLPVVEKNVPSLLLKPGLLRQGGLEKGLKQTWK